MRSFGETPGKREALLNKLVKISETPVKREETPGKGEEPEKPGGHQDNEKLWGDPRKERSSSK